MQAKLSTICFNVLETYLYKIYFYKLKQPALHSHFQRGFWKIVDLQFSENFQKLLGKKKVRYCALNLYFCVRYTI